MTQEEINLVGGRIIDLARAKTTGPAVELALKLSVSERTVKRLIKILRKSGIKIVYNRACLSYVITES